MSIQSSGQSRSQCHWERSGFHCGLIVCRMACLEGIQHAICLCPGPDDVRLVNGSNRCAGTVQMFYDGQWTTVGSDVWSLTEAAVVCRQLGCGSAVASAKTESETALGLRVSCKGFESALRECHAANSLTGTTLGRVMCSGNLAKNVIRGTV